MSEDWEKKGDNRPPWFSIMSHPTFCRRGLSRLFDHYHRKYAEIMHDAADSWFRKPRFFYCNIDATFDLSLQFLNKMSRAFPLSQPPQAAWCERSQNGRPSSKVRRFRKWCTTCRGARDRAECSSQIQIWSLAVSQELLFRKILS